jgi:predicted adenine nucleotide alpha hydrolase (AANH) superfamily ATPase
MCYYITAMDVNYQKQLDKEIEKLRGKRPRLLLHSCCGPCSSYVLEYLTKYFDVTLFWYNPCIWPEEEFNKRFQNQIKLIEEMGFADEVAVMASPWKHEDYLKRVKGLEGEPEGGERCTACFRMRLNQTAQTAKKYGFDWFCTTLTVSPHKDAQRINEIGQEFAKAYGVSFLPSDFKKRDGFKRTTELTEKYGIYRQNYCGCEFSKPAEDDPRG